ncbi:MAG: hypothetical protein A3C02_01170 [Candidatus Andersenbacteria bacterium RIFCSPHIGHO2_02_FULL_45_11]|uniref:3D domain-containing protein n=1 Tax=Candidatus Andersenbacteria bacterium RIFCSPHIGHO2_12_FULL_45_11 TaxID=1797281 RepID=A0A1G1X2H1_9BACT|nr:MAG: hypothetical protein A2805_03370 [Candidatus Andersenbacteria bacterium RIFCSPHIGHO2_01_FULL_46_36]OGY32371.1 MAG: hypothetical protein A3C02_01170 [Candidatus Andersenbacteria bacterium RIFCSPHIGHO2_02_FULL_45_11]OGY34212.1 MAG: hypothetical protein A3D99_03680 [Candidatus Andersenbacteria bacterium RIFCSPHIGHO2_12_FULL_45_11]
MYMQRRYVLSILMLAVVACVSMNVHAQPVQQYLSNQSLTAAHLSVSVDGEHAPSQSWWKRIWSYLGIRNARIRPEIGTTLRVESSAYASSPYQTDATPCITAAGTTVRPGVVATNFLPLGTIVSVDGKKYIVEDRMNARYDGYYMDIWFPSTSEALEFGRKKLAITIIGYGEPGDVIEPTPTPFVSPEPEKTMWRAIADFLVTKTYKDPNRYDVNCTN